MIRRRKYWGIQEEEERNRLSLEIYLLLKRLPYYRVLLLALSSTDQLRLRERSSLLLCDDFEGDESVRGEEALLSQMFTKQRHKTADIIQMCGGSLNNAGKRKANEFNVTH